MLCFRITPTPFFVREAAFADSPFDVSWNVSRKFHKGFEMAIRGLETTLVGNSVRRDSKLPTAFRESGAQVPSISGVAFC